MNSEADFIEWLVTAGLMEVDATRLVGMLLNDHKVNSINSLNDILNSCPSFLSTIKIPIAYEILIKKKIRDMNVKDLQLLTADELATMFENLSFEKSFCDEILRKNIAGIVLYSMSGSDFLKLSPEFQRMDLALFESVVQHLKAGGVQLQMLRKKAAATAAPKTAESCSVQHQVAHCDVEICML